MVTLYKQRSGLLRLLSKDVGVVVNHLLNAFEGCITHYTFFIMEEITSKVEGNWSSSLVFEVVVVLKVINFLARHSQCDQ